MKSVLDFILAEENGNHLILFNKKQITDFKMCHQTVERFMSLYSWMPVVHTNIDPLYCITFLLCDFFPWLLMRPEINYNILLKTFMFLKVKSSISA